MEFQDVVRRRRMVRRFTDEPVDPDQVERVLRNAVRAPSAGFAQGWAFVVLTEPADVARFWAATTPADTERNMSTWLAGMRTAPVLVVVLTSKDAYLDRYAEPDKGWADRDEHRWAVPYWHVDAGMASLLMLQTAVDEGLGACFFGVQPGEVGRLREAFGIPGEFAPTGVVALGHPGDAGPSGSPRRRARKPVDDVVHRGRWHP
ncbi:nitroreductase family protein [Cellulosimicrobium marinum]|uniref:nitroreductase family protein n=1 Tax=Cellulosimicrobium marinum TaxID=1638992 RepID=UPI001E604CAA|nr:nitroreductase family protein [Cellulosimicrobium marinum]MCB7136337.1 nitroreductase family protein [Cellulosimicrobium marinum]